MMPTHINRYQIISLLGEGGMGTVYLANDPNTNRQVAVKVLLAEYLRDQEFKIRFEREKNIAALLQHPAIVPVYDSGEDDGKAFIVMRLMRGGSLEDYLNQGTLAPEQIAKFFTILADALDEVHQEGIIHRDLKPSNILFDKSRNPHIADFGLARRFDGTQLTVSGSLLGSFSYMSPEQANNPSSLDGRSDIYSLGGILFKMLTGKEPYYQVENGLGLLYHHLNSPPPRIDELRPDLSSEWQDIINKAMAKKPEERYSTAKELSDAVQNLVYPSQQPAQQPNKVLLGILFGLFALLLFVFLKNGLSTERQPNPTPTIRESETKDGMVQVYVPAGDFLMGALDNDEAAFPDQTPQHMVYLDAYWIDQTEITNQMYQQCVEMGACTEPGEPETGQNRYGDPKFTNHPVTNVSWQDANAYCGWAERRLPTEAEWEKAARGTDRRVYPWENEEMAGNLANFCDASCELGFSDSDVDDGYAETAPVGSYPAGVSPYGALDMAGNVSEWVGDWYDGRYYETALSRNPTGPQSGTRRVLRGGSWRNEARLLRTAYRSQKPPTSRKPYSGFRCASSR